MALSAPIAGQRGGVGRYAAELCRRLAAAAVDDPDLELVALLTPPATEALGPIECETVLIGRHASRARGSWARIATEQAAQLRASYDLVHFFDLVGPVLHPAQRFTATAHDAKFVDQPEAFSRVQRAYKRAISRFALKRAAGIVAVSHVTKNQVVERLGATADRVHVVHSGPGFPGTATGRPPEGEAYFLSVGELTTSKNVPFLVRAFADAKVEARLVLVGRPSHGYEEIVATVADSVARDRIEIRTAVSDAEVDGLYRGALALLSSSRYEGFGFTPLEAMARGCPVIASRLPVTDEILAEGALLLPLEEPASWAGAIRRAYADEGWRALQADRGRARVAGFSWERTARGVLDVFRAVAGA